MTTFLRLAQCNLKCKWCDTKYAQKRSSGTNWSIDEIANAIVKIGCKNITITGGEPLLQEKNLKDLVDHLDESYNFFVCIETNGSILIPRWDSASWIADWKLPSSGMSNKMKLDNFKNLKYMDFIKFVIADKTDFDVYLSVRNELDGICSAKFALSPIKELLDPATLIEWCKHYQQQDVVISIQLHKLIYPNSKVEV
jgi:7-carboxy-7-deazaguanine synthase